MKRSRLVVVLVLLFGAALGARLLLRDGADPRAALGPRPTVEENEEPRSAADLASPQESQLSREPDDVESSTVTAPRTESRTSIAGTASASNDLRVRVVDTRGEPVAGLSLWLTDDAGQLEGRRLAGEPIENAKNQPFTGLYSSTSDSEGLVLFEEAREAVVNAVAGSALGSASIALVHDVTFEERPTKILTPEDLAGAEILTVQPDYGSVRGIVLGHDGRSGPAVKQIALQLHDEEPAENPFISMHSDRFAADEIEGGIALFPFVELDREWALLAIRGADYREQTLALGPRLHGERVEMRVQFGTREPILQFRVLDVDGLVYANSTLKAQLRDGLRSDEKIEVRTDSRGVFLAYFNLVAYSIFGVTVQVTTQDESGQLLVATSARLQELEPGVNDLGVLQLQPPAILARGYVFDESGTPVEGATVRVGEYENFDQSPWPSTDMIETKSDERGRFEITGAKNDEPRGVWAFHGEERSVRQALHESGVEHVLTLRALPTCSVEVRLAPGIPADQIRVVLVHGEPGGDLSTLDENVKSQEEGIDGFTSSFMNVLPRTYDVRVILSKSGEILAEVLGVVVRESATLAEFDLSDRLFLHSLRMTDSNGEDANSPGSYVMRPSDSDQAWSDWQHFPGTTLEVATTAPRIDLRLLPEEYREETVLGLQGERQITLRDPLQVRFVLDTAGELPEPPYSLQLNITLDGREVGKPRDGRAFTKRRRELVYDLPAAGTYRADWTFFQAGESFAIEGPVLTDHGREIQVGDLVGEQVRNLPLDSESLTELTRNPPWD